MIYVIYFKKIKKIKKNNKSQKSKKYKKCKKRKKHSNSNSILSSNILNRNSSENGEINIVIENININNVNSIIMLIEYLILHKKKKKITIKYAII